ncbi:Thiol:disulfide interchange protein DsbD precursor [Moellerella wisconsensis]|nr:Thiol:disulfide interchange protein DsbD precursor [Moellerella wisconsensis]
MLLLQANVTDNDLEQQALLQKLNVYGLPTILFYYRGTEVPNSRVYGFMDAKKFNQHLELIHQKIRAEE